MTVNAILKRGIPEVMGVDLTSQDPFGNFIDSNGILIPSPTYIPLTVAIPIIGGITKGTAGAAAPDQTLKLFSSSGGASLAAGLAAALYTVTVGKTFYITDIIITGNNTTPVQILVNIKQGATIIWEGYIKTDTQPIISDGIETQPQAPSGSAVTFNAPTSAGTTLAYFIAGYEQ